MSGLYPILEHSDLAVSRLASKYRKPLIEAELRAFVDQVQELENAIWQLASERGIVVLSLDGDAQFSEAVGHQLEVVGKILKQPRGNLTDAAYRLALRAKIKVLRSSGTVPELLAVFKCVEPDALITIRTMPPAYFSLWISTAITAAEAVLYRSFLRQARAGGVHGSFRWKQSADAALFRFDSGPGFDQGHLAGSGA